MRTLDRAVALLDVLGDGDRGLGITQLSQEVGLPPSTLHRLLAVLAGHGLVLQEPASRRYRLGPRVLQLARSFLRGDTLLAAAQPHLSALRSHLEESVFLTALVGDDAVCVATAESPRPLQFFMRVGQRMPYHAAASARSILAFRSTREIERALRRDRIERFTRVTPTSVEAIQVELERVRAQGYALCAEEMEVGVTAISAPIRDAEGTVTASVTVVAPSERLTAARLVVAREAVLAAAAAISAALGFPARLEPPTASAEPTACAEPAAAAPIS